MNKNFLILLPLLLFFAAGAAAGDLYVDSISYEPAPVAPGNTMVLWLFVLNDSGYVAENSVVELELDFPLSLQTGQEAKRELGKIAAHKRLTVEYKVLVDPKAVDGKYQIETMVGEGAPHRLQNFTVSVLSRTPKLEVIQSDIAELSPGMATQANLTIKNIGGSVAKNIVVKTPADRTVTSTGVVVEREIVSLGAVSKYVDHLDQGQETTVQMLLGANQGAELKNYSVPITMEYYDLNGTARTDTAYLGLKVTAEPDVDAVIDSVEPFAFPGTKAELTVDLFNIGLADAKYVLVELQGQGVEIAEPKQFIGTLEADDFDSFKTGITFAPTIQPGYVPITLNIIYKDDDLQEQVTTKVLNVKVLNAAEMQAVVGIGAGAIFLGLISLALQLTGLYVVAKFLYRKYKKFREKR